jgi:hypothetical protein
VTLTIALTARQNKPGLPVRIRSQVQITDDASFQANYNTGLGVKVGATAPTNVSDFAVIFHKYDAGGANSLLLQQGIRDAVIVRTYWSTIEQRTLPIGGEVLVGRYLFGFAEGESGAIQGASTPYHIT